MPHKISGPGLVARRDGGGGSSSDLSAARQILRAIGPLFGDFPVPLPHVSTVDIFLGDSPYQFRRNDFHVNFTPLLPQTLSPQLQMDSVAIETNRCFFLHLGIAVGVHPFALQVCHS
jgi:hypothetical protein